jgi:type II secretory pathway pseudopilin PulG
MTRFSPPTPVSSEDGFTLIELLVSMLTSTVVIGALFAVLLISTHQSSRTTDYVQSNQLGRGAMTNILEELHSACTGASAAGYSAIQIPTPVSPSTGPISPLGLTGSTNLWFVSTYSTPSSATAELKEITEHDINWTETGLSNTGKKLGKLTDYAFAGTGTPGAWVFPSLTTANAKARVLAENVLQSERASGEKIPFFQYFGYYGNTSEADYGQLETTAMTPPLTTEQEATNYVGGVAQVTIAFTQAPPDKNTQLSRMANFSNSVNLRFSPTSTTSGTSPCS